MSQGPPPTPSEQMLPIASQPFPGSLTPGWNDPPSIQYNVQSSSTSGRKKLNKRVPFPLQTNQPLTKPTAIVHAMPPCPLATSVACSNIAVVHPMQYPNQATPMHFTTLPANVAATTSAYTLPRESSQTPPPTASASGSATGSLPTMFVAAVPRQNSDSSSSSDDFTITSTPYAPPSSILFDD